MTTYIYREDCGWESEPFGAAGDDAAEAHVEATFRSHEANPDFDGDSGSLIRLDWDGDDKKWVGVVSFDGENMIPDLLGQRSR